MSKTLPLLVLLLSLGVFAQTTTSYQSTSGYVSSLNATTGYLQLGGSFHTPNTYGSGCYYGSCPAWPFSGYTLAYVLPNGTTATLTNFTGTANFTLQTDVRIQGTASGYDSTGAPVSVSVNWAFTVFCQRGCSKRYLGGTLSVTK
jgi:hypothetical protein